MSAPDLSDARAYAEAVAYGKLLAVREILDALADKRPRKNRWWWDSPDDVTGYHEDSHATEQIGWVSGYDEAVRVVKAIRLGVEK